MINKNFLFIIVLFLATVISFAAFWPDGKFHLIVCDVGQGDALLLTRGFDQILIDGGPNSKVLGCLARNMPFWDKEIELVVNTHPDADHLKGLLAVLQNYQAGQILANSEIDKTDLFTQFHDLVREKKIKVYSPQSGEKINLGEIKLTIFWPEEKIGDLAMWSNPLLEKTAVLGEVSPKKNLNYDSIVLLARYQDFTALLTGDISQEQEKRIVAWCQTWGCPQKINLLKISHHGSASSTSQEFLDYFRPQQAVISVGENSWGHPRQEVLDRLQNSGSRILRTDLQGDIKITDNGY